MELKADSRKRCIVCCATGSIDGPVSVNLSELVLRLILFDKVVLDSIGLREFSELVKAFGEGPVRELLASKAIDVYYTALTVGQIGQTALRDRSPMPLGYYAFAFIRNADRKGYVHKGLQYLHRLDGLNTKQVIKLKQQLVPRLLEPLDEQAALAVVQQSQADAIANQPHVKTAVALAISRRLNTEVRDSDFSLRIHPLEGIDFRTETDIPKVFQLNEADTHEVVGRGLLAVGGLHQRFAEMRAYNAISGFKEEELPIFEKKVDFLSPTIPKADAQVDRMKRVLALRGFGDLDEQLAKGRVDLTKLMEIRDTAECREFRDWLWSADSYTDVEIEERVNSVRDKLSWFARGPVGKPLRWLASTGLGYGAGDFTGTVGGALDTFLLDRILPHPGPLSFINNLYPSLFDKQEPTSWAEGFVEPASIEPRYEG